MLAHLTLLYIILFTVIIKNDFFYIQVKTFKQKVNQCKELLKKMPGIDQSPEEQQQTLIKYQEELQQKK